jgi:DNA-binding MarR family transcriptional regulator
MSTLKSRWDLSRIEVSKSATDAALHVVERLKREKDDVASQWETAIRLAHENGASLREIAEAAGVSPQTVSNICKH